MPHPTSSAPEHIFGTYDVYTHQYAKGTLYTLTNSSNINPVSYDMPLGGFVSLRKPLQPWRNCRERAPREVGKRLLPISLLIQPRAPGLCQSALVSAELFAALSDSFRRHKRQSDRQEIFFAGGACLHECCAGSLVEAVLELFLTEIGKYIAVAEGQGSNR